MTTWWYSDENKKVGPFDLEELTNLVQKGKVVPSTLLWREGFEAWQQLRNTQELESLLIKIPPPIPSKPTLLEWEFPMASNWRRFFARIFDLWLEIVIVGGVIGFTFGLVSPVYAEMLNSANSILLGLILTPLALVFDAGIYGVFGNTPGKALAGLRVGNVDASHLTASEYLGRNLSLWVSGLAFGLPLVYLFTMATQSRRLKKGEHATYDFEAGYRVRAKPWSWKKDALFVVLFLSLFAVVVALNVEDQQNKQDPARKIVSENFNWINPITGNGALINQSWTYQSHKNQDGQIIYMFSERTNNAAVVFGVEDGSNIPLDNYVQLFKDNVATSMQFTDGGIYDDYLGNHRWMGQGVMVDSANNLVDVQIVQLEDKFWRVVTIQTKPRESTDSMVDELRINLWGTVLNKGS
jgi:uncharacterized RDD family membrane protein YckC